MSRLAELNQFKQWLCTLPQSPFSLCEDNTAILQFNLNVAKDISKENGKGNECKEEQENNLPASKVNLMENMAQLWLQQEVKDLEVMISRFFSYIVIIKLFFYLTLSACSTSAF